MAKMPLQQVHNHKNRKRGYAAFLVCGVCVALNLLAYLPRKTFEEAEATEFIVTGFLVLVFIVAGLFAAISTLKNLGDIGLVSMLLASAAFVIVSVYDGSWEWRMRIALQLSYAILVLTFGTIGLLTTRRQAT
jgi:uncharacterized membrane protein YhaH (DUF805 family)